MQAVSFNNYGITENKPNEILDRVLSFELGDLNNQETKELFNELEQRGEFALLRELKSNHGLAAYIVDYEELTA